jgi:type IV secretion system protein VirB2
VQKPSTDFTRFTRVSHRLLALRHAVASSLILGAQAHAQQAGGLGAANQTLNTISTGLLSIGIVLCTIGFTIAGYKIMFQGARVTEVSHVFIGAIIVGAGATVAGLLLGQ